MRGVLCAIWDREREKEGYGLVVFGFVVIAHCIVVGCWEFWSVLVIMAVVVPSLSPTCLNISFPLPFCEL